MTGRRALIIASCATLSLSACRDDKKAAPASESAPSAAPSASLGPPPPPPPPKKGMVWIPKGALVAGTPPDRLPRIADEEMPGEQVILQGFYIDEFPYPNEEGAIPHSGVTRDQAAALCAERGKRLCTELEWERACKGPNNLPYEYGEKYRPDRCQTGAKAKLRPNGLAVGCKSEFGVADMHGGVWEWTSSNWGRGVEGELATLRGGNAPAGELVGRCANAMGRPPTVKNGTIGFRCCAGDKNEAEVSLDVVRGKQLQARASWDKKLVKQVGEALPDDAKQDLKQQPFRAERAWFWRPIGNEELRLFGGCSGLGASPACGVVVVRMVLDRPRVLAWVSSGHWAPMLHTDTDARDIWLFGGDDLGSFRRLIAYVWGRVSVGPKERRVPRPPKKKKKKKKKR